MAANDGKIANRWAQVHWLLVAQQVGEMRPGIHPIIDIEDVVPSAFLVLSELPHPAARNDENRHIRDDV